MKNRVLILMTAVSLGLALVFCCLWMTERRSTRALDQLCVYSAGQAGERFLQYGETGSDYDYRYAVSELTSFYNSYLLLATRRSEGTDIHCIYLNQLLGELMKLPQLSQELISCLTGAARALSEDVFDPNAYNDLFAVYNALAR